MRQEAACRHFCILCVYYNVNRKRMFSNVFCVVRMERTAHYCFVLVIVSVIVVIIIAPFIRQEVQLYTVP